MYSVTLFGIGVLWTGGSCPILGAQDAIAYLRDRVRVTQLIECILFNCYILGQKSIFCDKQQQYIEERNIREIQKDHW